MIRRAGWWLLLAALELWVIIWAMPRTVGWARPLLHGSTHSLLGAVGFLAGVGWMMLVVFGLPTLAGFVWWKAHHRS